MEIDVLIFAIISWTCCIGWKRRGLNSLMDFMAYSVMALVIVNMMEISQPVVLGNSLQAQLLDWIQYHLSTTTPESAAYFHVMNAIPVGTGIHKRDVEILHKIYEYSMGFVFGITLFIAIHIIRRSFLTIWPPRTGLWDSRWIGSIVSGLLGISLVLYLTAVFGLFTWFSGFSWLDKSLRESLFIHVLSTYNPW